MGVNAFVYSKNFFFIRDWEVYNKTLSLSERTNNSISSNPNMADPVVLET